MTLRATLLLVESPTAGDAAFVRITEGKRAKEKFEADSRSLEELVQEDTRELKRAKEQVEAIDEGSDLTPEQQRRLFEKFYEANEVD